MASQAAAARRQRSRTLSKVAASACACATAAFSRKVFCAKAVLRLGESGGAGSRRRINLASVGVLQVAGCHLAILRRFQFVRNALVLLQRRHAGALDGADVNERILAAGVRGNEAEPLGGVEKLDGASDGHEYFLRFPSS